MQARFTSGNGYELDVSPTCPDGSQVFIYRDTQEQPGSPQRMVATRDNETVAGTFVNRISALAAIMREEI